MVPQMLAEYYEIVRASSLFQSFYADFPDYSSAPILDKQALTAVLNSAFHLSEENRGVYLVRSGGSTQKPLVFPVDIAENLEQRAVLAKALSTAQVITPTTIALNMFGYADMYRTAAILDDILEKCMATTLAVSSSIKYEDAYDTSIHFQPDFILGTPSKLFLFARHLQQHGQTLNIKNLLFGGEFLLPSYIPLFQKYLGVQQIYSLYGSAETGIWAWSDYSVQPSLFRIIDGLIVEIENPDEQGYGNILVSNLYRKRFPVFRYSLGDIGRLVYLDDMPFLELKSRKKKSFSLYESNYSLDDFKEVLNELEAFQIQLLTNSSLDVEIRFLLVKDSLSTEHKAAFEAQKTEQIQEVLGYKLKHLEVVSGGDLKLYTDPVTGKTPLIADFRS